MRFAQHASGQHAPSLGGRESYAPTAEGAAPHPTEELLAQLYPNEFAPVERLTNAVALARKVLGDTGQTQWDIQTVASFDKARRRERFELE